MDIHSSQLPAPQAHAFSHATRSHEAQPAPIVATDGRRRPAVVPPGSLAADDVECPVCMSIFNDPFVTICGHAFCHRCISTHLAHRQNCPSCAAYLTADNIFPNFLLQMVVRKVGVAQLQRRPTAVEVVSGFLGESHGSGGHSGNGSSALNLEDVNGLLRILQDRKTSLEQHAVETNLELLLLFLQASRRDKALKLEQLQLELLTLEGDISAVAGRKDGIPAFDFASEAAGSTFIEELPLGKRRLSDRLSMRLASTPDDHLDADADAEDASMGDPSEELAASDCYPGQLVGSLPEGHHITLPPLPEGITAATLAEAQIALDPSASGAWNAHFSTHMDPSMAGAASHSQPGVAGPSTAATVAPLHEVSLQQSARLKKRRVVSQFEDLQQCYLQLRGQHRKPGSDKEDSGKPDRVPAIAVAEHPLRQQDDVRVPKAWRGELATVEVGHEVAREGVSQGLTEFSRILLVFTHCSRLRVLAQLPPASTRQSSAILSSIEFDRDSEFFATAGVSKRISIFEFAAVLSRPNSDVHSPALEISTRSKLSCVAWHKYVKSHLISSDYEGVVALWDVNTSQSVREYEAHEKRIWSVDFCHSDPMRFVSGSDDGWVKVWSTNSSSSIAQIDMKANVCCVKYSPSCPQQLAIGSADHAVHLYDLRKPNEAVRIFSGHRKAVAYVRYLNDEEVVSASTDSTLRLWNVNKPHAVRVYEGHVNEKNFVGLCADGEFIACGSELNEVLVYYKMMSKPVAKRVFSALATDPVGNTPAGQDTSQFISAVCWKPGTDTLLAANSQGTIKVMQLAS